MAVKNSRKVQIELEKRLKRSKAVLKDTSFFNNLAKETAEQMRRRTRLSKSAEKNGSSKRLKRLSESYKRQRKRYRKNLSGEAQVGRSNLTATGQMLDSLFGVFKNKSIIIDVKENRKKRLDGGPSRVNNKKLIDYNEDMGRRFFDLTKFEINDLRRKISDRILKALAKK